MTQWVCPSSQSVCEPLLVSEIPSQSQQDQNYFHNTKMLLSLFHCADICTNSGKSLEAKNFNSLAHIKVMTSNKLVKMINFIKSQPLNTFLCDILL